MKRTYTILSEQEEFQVEINNSEEEFTLILGKSRHRFKILFNSETLYSFLIDDAEVLEADLKFNQDKCDLYLQNIPWHLEVFDPRRRVVSQSEMALGDGQVLAPMPGKIVEVRVEKGQQVKRDQTLVIIEAMKMQNELNAPLDGVVQEVAVQAGDAVEAEQLVVKVAKA
jgi:biotin carboxyl carrier protein